MSSGVVFRPYENWKFGRLPQFSLMNWYLLLGFVALAVFAELHIY